MMGRERLMLTEGANIVIDRGRTLRREEEQMIDGGKGKVN